MITKKEVQHVAKLARLHLGSKEIGKMQKDISSILDYFNLLKEVNTEKIELTFHFRETESYYIPDVMRKDEVRKQSPEIVKKLIEMAPKKQKRYIQVKSILP